MKMDIVLVILIIILGIGFIRFIQLLYVSRKGFLTQLEYVKYSHSNIEPDGPSASNAYIGGEYTNHYVKAKYRIKNGMYLYKTVPQSVFGINNLDPVEIILFPKNEKKYIYKNRFSQWIVPILSTIILFIITIYIVLS